jgi:hypothetical protein
LTVIVADRGCALSWRCLGLLSLWLAGTAHALQETGATKATAPLPATVQVVAALADPDRRPAAVLDLVAVANLNQRLHAESNLAADAAIATLANDRTWLENLQ